MLISPKTSELDLQDAGHPVRSSDATLRGGSIMAPRAPRVPPEPRIDLSISCVEGDDMRGAMLQHTVREASG